MAEQYKPFLIHKLKNGSPVKDSMDWNIWIKSVPFKLFPEMKDIPSRSWYDQNGDEEFVPDNPVFKAYEMNCEFVFIGAHGLANSKITEFLSYLANGGMFKFYDSHTKIGRTKVRYVSYSEDILYRNQGSEDIVVFSVTLKVNDPITNIVLSK